MGQNCRNIPQCNSCRKPSENNPNPPLAHQVRGPMRSRSDAHLSDSNFQGQGTERGAPRAPRWGLETRTLAGSADWQREPNSGLRWCNSAIQGCPAS